MKWLLNLCLNYKYLVVFLTAVLVVFGLLKLREMPVDVFPEFAPPYVEVQTEGPGMSAFEIENLVTIPLEEVFQNIPGLDVIRSKSVQGLSAIRLIFKPGADQMEIRQLSEERLMTVLPNLVPPADSPRMLPPLSSTSRMLKIGLSSDTLSLMDLSMTAYWRIVSRLKQIPGVANVAIWGERFKMLTLNMDPERLEQYGLTVDEVLEVTSETLETGLMTYTPGGKTEVEGWVDTPNQQLSVRHVFSAHTPEEYGEISIYDRKKEDGSPLLLKDIGDVVWTNQPMIGDGIINDELGILLIVEKFPWGNTLEVTKEIERVLDDMKPGLQEIEIDTTIFRPATYIETSINNLKNALLIGSVLVVFVLLLFLWEWRVALISSIIIPLTMVITLIIIYFFGLSLNVMVLSGLMIAIGAIVDDAIVDVENISRRLRLLEGEKSIKKVKNVIFSASLEVRSVIIYASLMEIIVLIPVFFLDGLSGAFFNPLAVSYVIATIVSPIIALTITPVLILIFVKKGKQKNKESRFMKWLIPRYTETLKTSMKVPKVAYASIIGLLIATGIALPFLGQELLPNFKESDFLMHWLTRPGTSRQEMNRITIESSKELRAIPGVRNFGAHVGRAIAADEVVGIDFTENWVSIDPEVDYDQTLAAIQSTVDGYPGIVRDVQTYLKERIREVLTGSSAAIVVRIYGPNLDTLQEVAQRVMGKLKDVEGISDLHLDHQKSIPQIEIKVDLEKAQAYGIKPGDVRRVAAAFIAGTEVSDIHLNGKVYEVYVWADKDIRKDKTDIERLLISTPTGEHVRLSDIAEVKLAPTPSSIYRENNSRRLDVEANHRGGELGDVAREVEAILNTIDFPLEYRYELIGEFEERQRSQAKLLFMSIGVFLGMLCLLFTLFNSWKLTFLTIGIIPIALAGGVLSTFMIGEQLISLGSLVGFLTVLGVATRNGVMLLSHYQHLEKEEHMTFGKDLVIRGAQERLAPILMTAFATGFALLPMVLVGDLPGHEIEYPMGVVIIGGLITSTLLSLFVIPFLYLKYGKGKSSKH